MTTKNTHTQTAGRALKTPRPQRRLSSAASAARPPLGTPKGPAAHQLAAGAPALASAHSRAFWKSLSHGAGP